MLSRTNSVTHHSRSKHLPKALGLAMRFSGAATGFISRALSMNKAMNKAMLVY